ncbi:hypothetical protein [Streptomyces sp. A5-4]|uniref:hypothetical protein n=1 Tax=Streptomyces sp. A5-4 TaxID=3384771 RepID=UPI003DA82BA8
MTSAQRALGRAAQAGAGGLAGPVGLGWVDGQHFDIDLTAPPGRQARLAELACGCTGRCRGECANNGRQDDRAETQERQG